MRAALLLSLLATSALAQSITRGRLSAAPSTGTTAGDGGYVYSGCAGSGVSGSLCAAAPGQRVALDGGLVFPLAADELYFGSTANVSGIRLENGDFDWKFRKTAGTDTADLGIYANTSLFFWLDLSNGFVRPQYSIVSDVAPGGKAYRSDTGALWCMGAGGVGCWSYDGTGFTMGANLTETTHRGTITLSSGTGTATVLAGAICVCTDTSATPLVLQCAVASTTLTATQATGSHVIAYICL